MLRTEDSRSPNQHFGKFILVENTNSGVSRLVDLPATHLVSSELWWFLLAVPELGWLCRQ